MPRPRALATIVSVAPLTHAYSGIYMNGVPYLPWYPGHTVTVADATLTLPTVVRSEFDLVACGDRIAEKDCYKPGLKDLYLPS